VQEGAYISELGAISNSLCDNSYFSFSLFALTSSGQETKEGFEFSISFAACFQNDLVGLKVNGKTLIRTQKVTSDPVLGITHLSAYQDNKAVWVTNKDTKQQFPLFANNKMVKLNIMLNVKWSDFNVDLEKGKIIFIDNCFLQGTRQELTIKQFRKTVLLD
jgi:hypothetical protein